MTGAAPEKNGGHRAMDDIKASLFELQYYRDNLFIDSNEDDSAPENT